MSVWGYIAVAAAGALFGVLMASILSTIRSITDMQDVWGDDDDL